MCILPSIFSFFKKFFILVPLHLFSRLEEATEGVAPADQSAEERPKGIFTNCTLSPSCPPDISQSPPPYSPSVVPLYSSPPTISPVTISPDTPIKVEYLPDSIPVPSPIFLLQGYSSSTSTLSSTSLSTSQTFSTITNPTITSLPGQDVSHSVPLPRPIPILRSFPKSSWTLSDPCPSDSSLDVLPPLSSSIIYAQDLPSCSFAPSIVIPPSVLTLPPFHNTSSSKKSFGQGKIIMGAFF